MGDPTLIEYAARLLTGTGIPAAQAAAVAAGNTDPAPENAAARALRDGWNADTPTQQDQP